LIDSEAGSIFAFDLKPETPEASRLRWRTSPQNDGYFDAGVYNWADQTGRSVWSYGDDRTITVFDSASGKIVNRYSYLWAGAFWNRADRLYGFTADGLIYAMQLK